MSKVWDKLAGQPERPGCLNQVHVKFNRRLVLSMLLLFDSGCKLYSWGLHAWSFLPQAASAVQLCLCTMGVRQPHQDD
jgi:hypothetical protein